MKALPRVFTFHLFLPICLFIIMAWVAGCNLTPTTGTRDVPTVDGVVHTVRPGESLLAIAQTYKVTPQLLRRVNVINDPNQLKVGTRLFIPGAVELRAVAVDQAMDDMTASAATLPESRDGLYHTVQKGETLSAIAQAYKEYDVTTRELQRANALKDPSMIWVGQRLWIPRAKEVQDVETEPVKIVASQPVEEFKEDPRVQLEVKPQPTPEPTPQAVEEQEHVFPRKVKEFADKRFQWPIKDSFRIIRDFSMEGARNPGIDLGAEVGTAVYAAADGRVELVAGPTSSLGASLGNHVIIYHGQRNGKGIYTIYAHNESITVEAGQMVERGEQIAAVGRSGKPPESESGVLHFEVRELNQAIDPKTVLPQLN